MDTCVLVNGSCRDDGNIEVIVKMVNGINDDNNDKGVNVDDGNNDGRRL